MNPSSWRIEMAVLEQLGNRVFMQAAAVDHFNDHVIHSVVWKLTIYLPSQDVS